MIQVTTPLGSNDCVRPAPTSMGSTRCHVSLSASGSSSLSPSSETMLPKKGDGVESPGMARSQGIKAIGPTGCTNSTELHFSDSGKVCGFALIKVENSTGLSVIRHPSSSISHQSSVIHHHQSVTQSVSQSATPHSYRLRPGFTYSHVLVVQGLGCP